MGNRVVGVQGESEGERGDQAHKMEGMQAGEVRNDCSELLPGGRLDSVSFALALRKTHIDAHSYTHSHTHALHDRRNRRETMTTMRTTMTTTMATKMAKTTATMTGDSSTIREADAAIHGPWGRPQSRHPRLRARVRRRGRAGFPRYARPRNEGLGPGALGEPLVHGGGDILGTQSSQARARCLRRQERRES